ncbi:200K protein [Naranjilla chlorotic mosaic virus]|uniref:Non-structural replication polyprotein n=1 Tax=Naranjilla chlorotic mosaic virus TaxID=2073044 RepID=A0A2I7NAG0_9VIRU|nr:200K protein [Naranjilla chlorotic mosaic virus]AUR53413.1 200K protein [Naranjilla chlorotic mosaic virus]
MAFNSALEALNSTTHRDASTNPILNSVVEPLRDSLSLYPWLLPKEAIPYLLSWGIPNSGLGTTPHPHPVHKTVETFLLFNHWSCLARTSSTVMFMKPSKFKKLALLNPNFQELLNFRLTAADTTRYPETSLSYPSHASAFMHDALMYFSPSQILDLFIESPKLQTLYCSLVVPPEAHFTDLSLYPTLYTYKISGQTLHYIPESHNAGSYNQPLQALSWLKISTILSHHLQLSVTKLESWGPVHSLLIQRGLPPKHHTPPAIPRSPFPHHSSSQNSLLHQTSELFNTSLEISSNLVSFQTPDCLELPQATFIRQPLRHRLVPTAVYNALFTYTRAVRTLRTSDPAGFVRTQSNKPEYSWVTPSAWDNLQTFALLNSPHRPQTCYQFFSSPIQKLQLHFAQHWRTYLLALTPFLSASPLLLPLFNFKFPLPLPRLLSWFHRRVNSPLLLKNFLPFHLQASAGNLPAPALLVQLHQFLHHRHLLPTPRFLPKLEWHRPRIMTLIPRSRLILPLLSILFTSPSLYLHFFHSQTPQQLHDNYHLNLHPPNFQLSWELQAYQVSQPTSFLPLPRPLPAQPASSPANPRPVFQDIPRPPQEISPTPPCIQTPPSSDPGPSSSSGSENCNLSTHPIRHIPEPEPIRVGSLPQRLHRLEPEVTTAEANLHPIHTTQPSSSTVLPSGALTMDPAPEPSSCLNFTPLPSEVFSPLATDPTAVGLSQPFSSLFPADYFPMSAEFLTRTRHVPSNNLPLPKLDCLLSSFSSATNIPKETLWHSLQSKLPDSLLDNSEIRTLGLSTDILTALCYIFHVQCSLHCSNSVHKYGIASSSQHINIYYELGPPPHFSSLPRVTASAPHSNPTAEPLVHHALRFKFKGAFLPFYQAHPHTSSIVHAKNLISNMKNGFDGILSTLSFSSSGPSPREKFVTLDSLVDVATPRTVPLIHISGFAGCGKTHPLQALLKTRPFHDFRVSCPTNELRSEWKRDMAPSAENVWRFSTWESSLLKSSSILVIDEIYKLPRGYLDLSILADPSIRLVIILGDPLQGEYHSSSPHSSNHFLPSEVHRLKHYIDCYCFWSYRIPLSFAEMFGISSYSKQPGFVKALTSHPPNSKNLTNAINTALTLQQMGHHAITISSSQGITFDEAHTILLDRHTNRLSPSNCLVALTRSRIGVHFVGNLHLASNSFGTNYMFSQALAGGRINLEQVFPTIIPYLPKLIDPITSRRTRFVAGQPPSINLHQRAFARLQSGHCTLPPHIPVDHSEDFVISNPIIQGDQLDARLPTNHLPPTRLPLHSDLPPAGPSDCRPANLQQSFPTPFSPALFGYSFETLAATFLPAHDPELREIVYRDQSSNQFPHMDLPYSLSCQPSSLIAPIHHPARDPTLLPSSINKRLRFRASTSPYQITPSDQILGTHLYESLCRAYSRNPHNQIPFNPALFAECICINEYSQLSSKTRATIVANAQRSDPDWRITAVRIFAKAQHKVNDGSLFSGWKACQTLALMHDYVILVLGPVKKYQRFFDSKDRPPQIYYHCGHTPQQLSTWCQDHLSATSFVTNDYTSFDQSQHGEAVVLECLKMRRLNIPEHLISLHSHLKCSVQTQFGPLTCMRLTGEPGTYDDNSDYNLAVIYSQYDMVGNAVMISGDDSVICGVPQTLPTWPQVKTRLHLRFKTEFTSYPLFCGYYVSQFGAVRNPLALFAKLMIAVDGLTLPDKKLSYLSEFSVGHLLGDLALDTIPPSHSIYQTAVHDFFCRNCSPAEKLLLSLDPIPEGKILTLLTKVRWASQAFFSWLPQKARELLISKSSLPSLYSNPKVSQLESELLPTFN